MAGEVIPPPYVITADDKRGLIVVTGAAVLAFVWSCFLIRVWLRLQSREWRSDGKSSLYCTASMSRDIMLILCAQTGGLQWQPCWTRFNQASYSTW
jgi:hypothetical protein